MRPVLIVVDLAAELLCEWSLADLDGLPDVVAAGPHGEVDEVIG